MWLEGEVSMRHFPCYRVPRHESELENPWPKTLEHWFFLLFFFFSNNKTLFSDVLLKKKKGKEKKSHP